MNKFDTILLNPIDVISRVEYDNYAILHKEFSKTYDELKSLNTIEDCVLGVDKYEYYEYINSLDLDSDLFDDLEDAVFDSEGDILNFNLAKLKEPDYFDSNRINNCDILIVSDPTFLDNIMNILTTFYKPKSITVYK